MHRQDRCHVRYHALLAEEAGGLTDRWDGVTLAVARSPVADFNTAFVTSDKADARSMGRLLDRLREAAVPFTIQVPEAHLETVEGGLRAAGLDDGVTAPGMRVELTGLRPVTTPGVTVRRVVVDADRHHWIATAAEGFELPSDVVEAVTPASLLDRPGVELWLAEQHGLPAAAAATLTLNGAIGLHGVAVPERNRRHGLGATIMTSAILGAAELHPAKEAVLQATPLAYEVARRLGFRTVRPYRRFESPAAVTSTGAPGHG